jgi:hypothetical protein
MPIIPVLHLFVAETLMGWWNSSHRSNPLNKILNNSHFGLALQPRDHAALSQENSSNVRTRYHRTQLITTNSTSVSENRKEGKSSKMIKSALVVLLITASLGMAIYTCSVHQRGTMDLMTWLRQEQEIQDLLLLMPCHHTPGLAFVHRINFHLDYLDCSPGLPEGQLDEADVFYQNPILFLNERFSLDPDQHEVAKQSPDSHFGGTTFVKNPFYSKDSGLNFKTISEPLARRPWPTHIAMYNSLFEKPEIVEWLQQNRYVQHISFFHAHFADGRVGTEVLVFRKQ